MKKSFMTRMLAVTLSAAMAFSLSSASMLTTPEAAAKKLAMNKKAVTISLKAGKTKTLKLKNYKKWNITKVKTNKKAIAAVKKTGSKAKRTVLVTAGKKGTAKLTLTLGKRKTANGKSTKYSKKITKKVTVNVTKKKTTPSATPSTAPSTTPSTAPSTAPSVTPGALHIASAEATKANVFTVTFSSVVANPANVKFTVLRGTSDVKQDKVEWNTDGTVATLTMVSKMQTGTYTIKATNGTETTEATAEVKAQEVKEIILKGTEALTEAEDLTATPQKTEKTKAIVYYDVVDQYGTSMKETVNIDWNTSAGKCTDDRSKGRLEIRKTTTGSAAVFNYGEKLFVTGVYNKTGVHVNKTYDIGREQAVDTIKSAGFIKKNGSKIETGLPKDFKSGEYFLLYDAQDQLGNPMPAADYVKGGILTFVSENPLVVQEIKDNNNTTKTVDGHQYCAANVIPGLNKNAGGDVTVKAISTKTGASSTINFVVGSYRKLASFTMSQPSKVVADGDTVEIPFTALDDQGNAMTNFRELASQSDFSRLSFSCPVGDLRLVEKDDGTAKLEWADTSAEGQWNSNSTDDVNRPVSLTAIVVGGKSDNLMLYVQAKRRPDGILSVDTDDLYVDGSMQQLDITKFKFVDQYGDEISKNWIGKKSDTTTGVKIEGYRYDNGFFSCDTNIKGQFTGTDYLGYNFYVLARVAKEYTDKYGTFTAEGKALEAQKIWGLSKDPVYVEAPIMQNTNDYFNAVTFQTKYLKDQGVTSEQPCEFMIVKKKASETTYEKVSPSKDKTFKVVGEQTLTGYAVSDLDMINVVSNNADEAVLTSPSALQVTGVATDSKKDVELTASFGGKTVKLPKKYYAVQSKGTSPKFTFSANAFDSVNSGNFKWTDLYDEKSAKNVRKDYATDTLQVNYWVISGSALAGGSKLPDSDTIIEKEIKYSDESSAIATIESGDTAVLHPTQTEITLSGVNPDYNKKLIDDMAKTAKDKTLVIKDQYGTKYFEYTYDDATYKVNNVNFSYTVKDVVENKDGYVDNNFTVSGNSSTKVTIKGAECGDTFTLVVKAEDKDGNAGAITKTVKVTVGADNNARINGTGNIYMTNLVKGTDGLQKQLETLMN